MPPIEAWPARLAVEGKGDVVEGKGEGKGDVVDKRYKIPIEVLYYPSHFKR